MARQEIMFSKKEILFWVLALTAGIILAWSCRIDATEVKEKVEVDFYLEEKQKTLGILETYIQLSKINKKKNRETLNKFKKKPIVNLENVESINLHSTYGPRWR